LGRNFSGAPTTIFLRQSVSEIYFLPIGKVWLCSVRFDNLCSYIRLLTAVFETSILIRITNTAWPTAWRRVLGDHR